MGRVTYDAGPAGEPRVGDVLRTERGHEHLVVSCRQVRSRVSPSRWALVTRPVGVYDPEEHRVLPLRWHPRGRRR